MKEKRKANNNEKANRDEQLMKKMKGPEKGRNENDEYVVRMKDMKPQ